MNETNNDNVPIIPDVFLNIFLPYNPKTKKVNRGRSGISAIMMALGISIILVRREFNRYLKTLHGLPFHISH